jgi:hypothetical protein
VDGTREILAETATSDGVRVVLYEDTWTDHVLDPETGHTELREHLEQVLGAVAAPDHREPDPRPGRERFFKQDVGPSRWLMVVVSFEATPARVVTALGYGRGQTPGGWIP